MPTKIRLQRKGKKGHPYYHVVIADGRAPRDGKFIERIGIYNPVSKPAEIDINFDRALYWLQAGAEPTDTVNALLKFKGVNYKFHLLKGVNKGAMTLEMAEAKYEAWQKEKQEKFISKLKEVELQGKDSRKKRMEAEMKVNETRAKELQAKRAKELKDKLAAEEPEEIAEVQETEAEEVVAEAPVIEEPVAEEVVAEAPVIEEPVAEEEVAEAPVIEEPVAEEEVAEAPVVEEAAIEEVVAEAPKAEEAPEAEEPASEEETETKA
jgi:small subunit ribosomal protein S16